MFDAPSFNRQVLFKSCWSSPTVYIFVNNWMEKNVVMSLTFFCLLSFRTFRTVDDVKTTAAWHPAQCNESTNVSLCFTFNRRSDIAGRDASNSHTKASNRGEWFAFNLQLDSRVMCASVETLFSSSPSICCRAFPTNRSVWLFHE